MPRHIEHIDASACKKERAALYLEFHSPPFKNGASSRVDQFVDHSVADPRAPCTEADLGTGL
jgi:hypothetical protein